MGVDTTGAKSFIFLQKILPARILFTSFVLGIFRMSVCKRCTYPLLANRVGPIETYSENLEIFPGGMCEDRVTTSYEKRKRDLEMKFLPKTITPFLF